VDGQLLIECSTRVIGVMALLAATLSRVFEQARPLACQTSRAVMRNRRGVLVLAVCEDALDGLDVLQEGHDDGDVVL